MTNQPNGFNQRLLEAAEALKLPHHYSPLSDGVEIKLGPHRYLFRYGATPYNDFGSTKVGGDKFLMNRLLAAHGFPVPKSRTISRERYHAGDYCLDDLPFPVVAKPTAFTARGYQVICNIQNLEELEAYFEYAFLEHQRISIEQFCADLKHYRVLVLDDKVIGVVQREPARVIGDGLHNIEALIALENNKRQTAYAYLTMGDLVVDQEYEIRLRELGLTLKSIPEKGRTIRLCYNANSSRGGTMTGMGDQICSENEKLFVDAAKTLNLKIVGYDVVCTDINIPIAKSEGYIIEANICPDITIHETPLFGKPHPVAKIIFKKLIRQHPFYYLQHRLKRILPHFLFNPRLLISLVVVIGLGRLTH